MTMEFSREKFEYLARRYPSYRVAEEMGLNIGFVREKRQKLGIKLKFNCQHKNYDEQKLKELLPKYPDCVISEMMKIPIKTISFGRRKLGTPVPQCFGNHHNSRCWAYEKDLRELSKTKNITQIARKLGKRRVTIERWMKRMGIIPTHNNHIKYEIDKYPWGLSAVEKRVCDKYPGKKYKLRGYGADFLIVNEKENIVIEAKRTIHNRNMAMAILQLIKARELLEVEGFNIHKMIIAFGKQADDEKMKDGRPPRGHQLHYFFDKYGIISEQV